MDRCPNCGATVRVGAKFCTTCGMRLPEPAATAATNEESSRSPFDSTSTVASRWPSRSVYSSPESTSTETIEEAPVPSLDDSTVAEAATEIEPPTSDEPSEAVSTWGAWTPPTSAEVETDETTEAASTESEAPSTWGASEPSPEEPAAEEVHVEETAAEGEQAEEAVPTGWARTGETDFLQLPEQPDPAAWKSIESELAGSPELEAVAETDDDSVVDEVVVEEVVEEEAEAEAAPSSPSIERAYVLLEELRIILEESTAAAAPPEAPYVPEPPSSLEAERPTDEAVARFAELRAAVDTGREHPRDIDTMLDLSGRLDVIAELHEAYESLVEAAFGDSDDDSDEETDED